MAVAPFTGAWIEISLGYGTVLLLGSLPSRERGLKSVQDPFELAEAVSLPSRERGLKFSGIEAASVAWGRSLHGSVD